MEKESSKVEKKTANTIDYRPFLNKLYVCLIILIVLVSINTVALLLSLKDNESKSSSGNNNTNTNENVEYDVSMFEEVDENELISKVTDVNNNDIQVVYVGRATCGYCVKFLPSLQKAQEEFGYKTIYLDITDVTQNGYDKITALDPEFFEEFGATPMIALFQNGKFIGGHVGYMEYSDLEQFLTAHGITK